MTRVAFHLHRLLDKEQAQSRAQPDIFIAGTLSQSDLPRRPVGVMSKQVRILQMAGWVR